MRSAEFTGLLRLASPLLPVGAYSYSQGLEWAVEASWVRDAPSAGAWVADALILSLGRFEAPIVWRQLRAWAAGDVAAVAAWNDRFLAGREGAELYRESVQMGYSLTRLLADLGEFPAPVLEPLTALDPVAYPTAYAFAAHAWGLPAAFALDAYLWSWAENQVAAAIKLVPLGQVAGQKLLSALRPALAGARATALGLDDAELSNATPGLALAASRHEGQYSRLFRS